MCVLTIKKLIFIATEFETFNSNSINLFKCLFKKLTYINVSPISDHIINMLSLCKIVTNAKFNKRF